MLLRSPLERMGQVARGDLRPSTPPRPGEVECAGRAGPAVGARL